jgi:putative transposase
MTMQVVERHIIDKNDPRWWVIDAAAFLAKNLYNATNYLMRQHFFATGQRLNIKDLYHAVRETYPQDYEALPRKVSNQVIRHVLQDWASFKAAHREWRNDPDRFLGEPRIPRYKHKTKGRVKLTYEHKAVGKGMWLKTGYAVPSQLDIAVKTQVTYCEFCELRIVPRHSCYIVEIVYEKTEANPIKSPYIAGLDIGLNNLAAVASNKPGLAPLLVNGRPLKSINQFYHKRKAKLQSQLPTGQKSSHRIRSLTHKRNLKVEAYLHTASRRIIDWCVEQDIAMLVIGKNAGWKQNIAIGKSNNQSFTQIPFARFIEMLQYKGPLAGVTVITIEESYTSKCSFLDQEAIQKHRVYAGKRIQRGLFRASDGRLINADINGALNIARKAVPDAFADGIEGVAVRPVWLRLDEAKKSCA